MKPQKIQRGDSFHIQLEITKDVGRLFKVMGRVNSSKQQAENIVEG